MDLNEANLQYADLRGAYLKRANLRGAKLEYADLRRADLWEADLRETDWDFSSGFSLSCRGSNFTCSLSFIYQNLAHLCTLKVDEGEQAEFDEILKKIRHYALKSPRADDLGLLDNVQTKGESNE
jgi:hypothetical protein